MTTIDEGLVAGRRQQAYAVQQGGDHLVGEVVAERVGEVCPRTRQSTPRRGGRSYGRSSPYQRMNWLSTAVQSKWPLAGRAQSARKLMGSPSAT